MFFDLENDAPFVNQWQFLEQINRYSADELNTIYDSLFIRQKTQTSAGFARNGKIEIAVNNKNRAQSRTTDPPTDWFYQRRTEFLE